MKTLFTTFVFLFITTLSFGQFEFDKMYQSKAAGGATQYFRIYEDGLVLMVATKDDLSKVKEYFNRESEDTQYIVLYRSQSKIKDGIKASFVIENDGNKLNCIAQGAGKTVSLVMLSPNAGKQQLEFTVIE